MSRKSMITIAAAATVAVAALASTSSTYARGFVGGGFARGGGVGFARGGGVGFARGGAGNHFATPRMVRTRGSTLTPIFPVRPRPPVRPPIWVWHHHDHHHWVFRGGSWVIDDVAVESPVVLPPASTPAPCSCLTKTYTPAGLVVFADVCTKESASAPATSDTADASQAPTTPVPATATPIAQVPTAPNYAGRTYQDYLAANPQAAQPQAAEAPPQPGQQQQN